MKKVTVSPKIKEKVPATRLGVIYAEITYAKDNPELWQEIDQTVEKIQQMDFEQVKQIPQIATTREAYRLLGKEPSRYRPSAEALFRRIIKGKGLYKISNIVDTINLASLQTGYSIGGYDFDKIRGDIIFDLGKSSDEYRAIGRGIINVENLPVFRDELGAFGSPTTDSERTMITDQTERVLLIVINFGVDNGFENDVLRIRSLVQKYASGKCFAIEFIE